MEVSWRNSHELTSALNLHRLHGPFLKQPVRVVLRLIWADLRTLQDEHSTPTLTRRTTIQHAAAGNRIQATLVQMTLPSVMR